MLTVDVLAKARKQAVWPWVRDRSTAEGPLVYCRRNEVVAYVCKLRGQLCASEFHPSKSRTTKCTKSATILKVFFFISRSNYHLLFLCTAGGSVNFPIKPFERSTPSQGLIPPGMREPACTLPWLPQAHLGRGWKTFCKTLISRLGFLIF